MVALPLDTTRQHRTLALLSGRDDVLERLEDLVRRPAWHADAACREHPELTWFLNRGEPSSPAKAICAGCLVRQECPDYALADPALVGVWGGLSGNERRHMG